MPRVRRIARRTAFTVGSVIGLPWPSVSWAAPIAAHAPSMVPAAEPEGGRDGGVGADHGRVAGIAVIPRPAHQRPKRRHSEA